MFPLRERRADQYDVPRHAWAGCTVLRCRLRRPSQASSSIGARCPALPKRCKGNYGGTTFPTREPNEIGLDESLGDDPTFRFPLQIRLHHRYGKTRRRNQVKIRENQQRSRAVRTCKNMFSSQHGSSAMACTHRPEERTHPNITPLTVKSHLKTIASGMIGVGVIIFPFYLCLLSYSRDMTPNNAWRLM